jgi:hypothetical protein
MAEVERRVRPTPTDAYLANPHRGCCTFQHFNGDELFAGTQWSEEGPREFPPAKAKVIDGYLPTTVAYCRWFWEVVEPEEGKFDFSVIDKSIETARARGQTLAIRIMAFGSAGQPMIPKWYRDRYPTETVECLGDKIQKPLNDSPEYLEKYGRVIRECGRRYDGHPDIETVDVGYIGPWGEGAGEMSIEQMNRFNQVHQEAFPTTTRLVEICGVQGKVGMQYKAGWRWNGYGDLWDPGSTDVVRTCSWNHTFDVYPSTLIENGAVDNWKKYPVHCETGGVPMSWYEGGFDIDFILQQGLKYHTTYFMPKSCRLPAEWMSKFSTFCNNIGYRFVYRQALFSTPIKAGAGNTFRFNSWIENMGCAPIYRPYAFALRLRQGDREEIITLDEVDIRTWLPGDALIETRVKLPPSIKPGYVHLAAGLIDPKTRAAKVSFAVKETFSDRWVSLGGMEVQ